MIEVLKMALGSEEESVIKEPDSFSQAESQFKAVFG
jgi:hypothetical protein